MNKKYRIKKSEEFSKIIRYKHFVSSASFNVYYSSKAGENARVGISASKKIGDAVTRNRVKRQIREMARALIDFENYDKDLVIIVKKAFLDNDYQTNKNSLEKALKKAII